MVTRILEPGDARCNIPLFNIAKAKKLEGLAEKEAYQFLTKDEVLDDSDALRGRVVLSINNDETKNETFEARFPVQGHNTVEKFNFTFV